MASKKKMKDQKNQTKQKTNEEEFVTPKYEVINSGILVLEAPYENTAVDVADIKLDEDCNQMSFNLSVLRCPNGNVDEENPSEDFIDIVGNIIVDIISEAVRKETYEISEEDGNTVVELKEDN